VKTAQAHRSVYAEK